MIKKIPFFLLFCLLAYGQVKPLPNNAYELKISDDCVAKVGDDKSATFKSQIDFKFWGEDTVTFLEENVTGTQTYSNGVIELDESNRTVQYKLVEGAIKWIEVLKVKPTSNKWSLKLAGHEEFNFAYQTPFVIETLNIPGSSVETFKRDGEDWIRLNYPSNPAFGPSERPLNIDGSYAIYHKSKKDNKYKTGKVLHIPRSKATDADGKWVWVNQSVQDGYFTETIPQSFLDIAKYPVIVNATFGYTTLGGTGQDANPHYQLANGPYLGAAGTGTSMTFYGTKKVSGTCGVTLGAWVDNGGVPGNLVDAGSDTQEVTVSQNLQEWSANFNGSPTFSASNYHLGLCGDATVTWYYDTDSFTEDSWYDAYTYSAGVLENFNPTSWLANRRFTVYVTYTPSAAGFNMWLFRNNKTGGKLSKR